MALTFGANLLTSQSNTYNLGSSTSNWNNLYVNYINGRKTVIVGDTVSLPTIGSTSTYQLTGLTANHYLVAWNFSTSPENCPPATLTWTTGTGQYTITHVAGATSETIKPVFVSTL